MIYLDNAATTKMSENALKTYNDYASANFFNPSAPYKQAFKVAMEIDDARQQLKKMLGAKKGDIIFTSGATEANNLAIKGSEREGNWEYVFSMGEHPSVMETAKAMQREGKNVFFIPLKKSGEANLDELEKYLSPKTRFVSCMLASNITGAVNDIKLLSSIVRKHCPHAVIHVDAVQAFKKIEFSVDDLDIDLLSISGHKFHGPKGCGALYVKNKASLKNIVYGGGQEYGIRSGTENVAGIMSMLAAANEIDTAKNFEHVLKLKKAFIDVIQSNSVKVIEGKNPYIVMLLFDGVNGETLVRMLEDEVIVAKGSACSSKKAGNYVLENMGYSRDQVKGAVRVSFSADQTQAEVIKAAKMIKAKYLELYERTK